VNLEYAMSFDVVDVAFAEVVDYFNTHANNPLIIVLRACGPDKYGYLSCCQGRKTLFVEVSYDIRTPKEFHLNLEKILLKHGGRVSWSRLIFSERSEFLSNYPEFPKFLQVKKELDPENVFSNQWNNRILFGEKGAINE